MQAWPRPKNAKKLRGFLGLTGYYRRFIKNYRVISRPLTNLLKKDSFGWNDEAELAFEDLKQALSNAPVLALPNFQKPFVVETDASKYGVEAILQQEGHPVAYISKALAVQHHALSTYEKEFIALVFALEKWRPYLFGRRLTIRTDHQSLKHQQRILTHPTAAKIYY